MGSSDSPLTPLERAFLERLFASVPGVRLSGGGALAVHLGHRRSLDLDLFVQEHTGHRVLDALEAAKRRDAGLTPAGLAWAISQVPLDRLPEGLLTPLTLDELRRFRDRLVESLQHLAFPV